MPDKVKVRKSEVLEKLKTNLKLHEEIYKKSLEGYKKKFIHRCEDILSKARKNNFDFSELSRLIKPENHSSDYRDAIAMIDMHVEDTIVLLEHEFMTCILNKWDWMRTFRKSFISNVAFCSSSSSTSSSAPSKRYSEYFGESEDELED